MMSSNIVISFSDLISLFAFFISLVSLGISYKSYKHQTLAVLKPFLFIKDNHIFLKMENMSNISINNLRIKYSIGNHCDEVKIEEITPLSYQTTILYSIYSSNEINTEIIISYSYSDENGKSYSYSNIIFPFSNFI